MSGIDATPAAGAGNDPAPAPAAEEHYLVCGANSTSAAVFDALPPTGSHAPLTTCATVTSSSSPGRHSRWAGVRSTRRS